MVIFGSEFTIALVPAGIGAIAAIIAALLGRQNAKKIAKTQAQLQEVHVLVNSRLQHVVDALDEMTQERDKLAEETETAAKKVEQAKDEADKRHRENTE